MNNGVPLYLNKINSDKKAMECAKILEAVRPTHYERLWLVGFLRYVSYSLSEVLEILQEHAQWADYNQNITSYQVGTVFHQKPQRTQSHSAPRARKWALTSLEVLKIRRQKSITISKILCEENKAKGKNFSFAHPERLLNPKFNPSAEFLTK